MIKVTLWIFFLAIGSYALFCGMLYLKQRTMIYYPTPAVRTDEADILWLENQQERLKVWNIRRNGSKALIYFGGNAENVALNLPVFKRLFSDFSLYLPNYRGYGGSSGSPSEAALFSDARRLLEEVAQEHEYVMVMGRSLGSGVAAYLASEGAIDGLILVTPFDSMTHLASSYYPFLPVSLLLKDRYESASYLEGSIIPTLVLIAGRDEIIPRKRADGLVAVLNEATTRVQVVADVGHNNIESHPSYLETIKSFVSAP